MNNSIIKVTYIPKEDREKYLVDSLKHQYLLNGVLYSDMQSSNTIMLYNSAEDIYINDELNNIEVKYIRISELMPEIEKHSIDSDTIIVTGFDIDIDFIKENMYPILLKQEDVCLIVNIFCNDNDIFKSKAVRVEELEDEDAWNTLKNIKEEEPQIGILLSMLGLKAIDDIEGGLKINLDFFKKDVDLPKGYKKYTYEDEDNYISIEKVDNNLICISDDDCNEIVINKNAKDFIINILSSLEIDDIKDIKEEDDDKKEEK